MLIDSLSKLFNSVITDASFYDSLSIAGDMIEQGVDMPDDLECLLINFLINKDIDSFNDLSREVLTQNLLGDYVENIRLISFLAKKKWLPLRSVAFFLNAVPYSERVNLTPAYQKVLEVADLVCEDLSDGVMNVEDDDLLLNALNHLELTQNTI
jgi:hypothetical protein